MRPRPPPTLCSTSAPRRSGRHRGLSRKTLCYTQSGSSVGRSILRTAILAALVFGASLATYLLLPAPTANANPLLGLVAVAAGNNHTCALTNSGGVKCWGQNAFGQLGDGTNTNRYSPVDVSGLTSGVVSISALGGEDTCALTTSGGIKCWGWNQSGQLGTGSNTGPQLCGSFPCSTVPVDVVGLTSGVASVSAGVSHACAVTTAGNAKCWGYNNAGQLGNGVVSTGGCRCITTPVDVLGLSTVAAISAGAAWTCALTTSGGVKCWGDDVYGFLGDAGACSVGCSMPVDVSGLTSGVASISAGWGHTCAITTAGGAKCWGDSSYGQLGDGTSGNPSCGCQRVPVDVYGLTSGAVSVSAGGSHACVVTSTGSAKCWGRNLHGALGNGTLAGASPTPVDVSGPLSGVNVVSVGGEGHTCALMSATYARCWGDNVIGQLGMATNIGPEQCTQPGDFTRPCSTTPVPVLVSSKAVGGRAVLPDLMEPEPTQLARSSRTHDSAVAAGLSFAAVSGLVLVAVSLARRKRRGSDAAD